MERYITSEILSALRSIDCSLKSICLMQIELMKKNNFQIPTSWLPGGDYSPVEVAKIKGIDYVPPDRKGFFK